MGMAKKHNTVLHHNAEKTMPQAEKKNTNTSTQHIWGKCGILGSFQTS